MISPTRLFVYGEGGFVVRDMCVLFRYGMTGYFEQM
jgi:hypothetical protein